jgi:hypothetical protein
MSFFSQDVLKNRTLKKIIKHGKLLNLESSKQVLAWTNPTIKIQLNMQLQACYSTI